MKIVYCTDSICYPGGIQTITIVKANALANIPGNEVWIVVTDNKQSPLKPLVGVKLVDLDVNYFADDWKGYFYVVKNILLKRRIHKKRLRKVLDDIQPDVVISTGTSEKNTFRMRGKQYGKLTCIGSSAASAQACDPSQQGHGR